MSRTNLLENLILRHLAGETTWVAPATLYLGLLSDDAGEDGSGTELSGNGYARKAVPLSAVAGNVLAMSSTLQFIAAGAAWTVKGRAVWTALTGGDMYYIHNLTTALSVPDGQSYRVSSLTITAD